MSRTRVLLCEDDAALASILVAFFTDEQIDVRCCTSLEDIQTALRDDPNAIVVSDSWSQGSRGQLSAREYDEIVSLGRVATVIVTTGRSWAARASEMSLGERVVVVPKPYDLDQLLDVIRASAVRGRQWALGLCRRPEEQER
jgi:DNA-binding NtrC family response regulator